MRKDRYNKWKDEGVLNEKIEQIKEFYSYKKKTGFGVSFVRDGVVISFISMEGLSILENVALAGVPVPKLIRNALEVINKKDDKEDE